MAQEPSADIKALYEYALNKERFLNDKGKQRRAAMWRKACQEIRGIELERIAAAKAEATPIPIINKDADTEARKAAYIKRYREYMATREERCKASGMVKRKIGGVTMWRYPLEYWSHTASGVMLTAKKAAIGKASFN